MPQDVHYEAGGVSCEVQVHDLYVHDVHVNGLSICECTFKSSRFINLLYSLTAPCGLCFLTGRLPLGGTGRPSPPLLTDDVKHSKRSLP